MPDLPRPARKPRLLWASVYCLLDTSSGASMAVREMLLQLVREGYEVHILSASVFDHERGTAGLRGQWPAVQGHKGRMVALSDGPLDHQMLVTASPQRGAMTCAEERAWFTRYREALRLYRPDVVYYYGGQPLDLLIATEARSRGIPVAFYLANGHYMHSRWCRDVDLILTDSQATSDLYQRRLGVVPVPVGAFIDPVRVVAPERTPKRILFVNPRLEKGAALVIRLAMLLEKRRPDIVFEVVESRGGWGKLLIALSAAMGQPREALSNVVVTAHTSDMRPVYGRARLLLAPSLWWESSGRVLVEAMLNSIPPIITDRGGMREMARDAGIILRLDDQYHEKPFTSIPSDEALEPLLQRIEALYDDEADYARMSEAALRVGQTHHRDVSTRRLLQALMPLVALQAGDSDTAAALRRVHRHGLPDLVDADAGPAPDS